MYYVLLAVYKICKAQIKRIFCKGDKDLILFKLSTVANSFIHASTTFIVSSTISTCSYGAAKKFNGKILEERSSGYQLMIVCLDKSQSTHTCKSKIKVNNWMVF